MIHNLAHATDDCRIGEGTSVWQFASIIRGAVLGANCNVGAGALIDAARIGDGCLVSSGSQLHPGLEAGDEVFFGPGCVVCNDPWPRVRKGDFDSDALLNGFVTVRIGRNCSLGARSVILPGVEIGAGSMVASGAIVDCCIPAGHLYKRDGDIVEIGRRPVVRMRPAGTAGLGRSRPQPGNRE